MDKEPNDQLALFQGISPSEPSKEEPAQPETVSPRELENEGQQRLL